MSKNSYESGEKGILRGEKFSLVLRWGIGRWGERWLSKVKDLRNIRMVAYYLARHLVDMSLQGS